MAVRLGNSGESYLKRTGYINGACTIMGYFKISVNRNDYCVFCQPHGQLAAETDDDGVTLALWDGTNLNTTDALAAGQWYHIAVTAAGVGVGSAVKLYLDGVLKVSATLTQSPKDDMEIGSSLYGEYLNGAAAYLKVWSAVLGVDEIAQEMGFIRPVRAANLYIWSPMFSGSDTERCRDYSGNGYNWTKSGTLSDVDGPPVFWGAPAPLLRPAVGVTVTPTPAEFTSSAVDPAVILGATSVTPDEAEAVTSAVDPGVVLGALNLTPGEAAATTSAIDPAVIEGGITMTPDPAGFGAGAVDPGVILGVILFAPDAAEFLAGAVDPAVWIAGALVIVPPAAAMTASAVAPVVIYGAVLRVVVRPSAGAAYELRILTPDGVELARIPAEAFDSFTYERRLNGVGQLTARFKQSNDVQIDPIARTYRFWYPNRRGDRVEVFVPRYAILDVWRRVPGGKWYRDDTYLKRGGNVSMGGDDVLVTALAGDHLNTIFKGAPVAPESADTPAVGGYADRMMKDLVNAWAGPAAPAIQRISDFLIDGYADQGLVGSENPRGRDLLAVLQGIAKGSHVDFYVVHLDGGVLLFTANRPWGRDLRYETNRCERSPYMLFAPERGNMENPELWEDEAALDGVYVAGFGRSDAREVVFVPGASINATRFNRRFGQTDARQLEPGDTEGYELAGRAALAGQDAQYGLKFDVPETNNGYGVEWDLGDWVSARFLGMTFDSKVEAVLVDLSASGERVRPSLTSI
ncbi:MAG: hypothetical protein JXB47_19920 [Anaerolineae bacterium]|nr:hypothetical protein [Anaerolineae bacterium]